MNPVERAIAEVWRDLLGVQEVAPGDDFFALGGHSLAAVRLFAKIRKQFGVDLPLATLFQAPTLAELASVVSKSGGLDTTQAVEVLKKISSTVASPVRQPWSPLVAISKGDVARTPLFCVHGAGGNVLNFKVISDRLGRDQPFYGLQAQGVDGLLAPLTSIEAMASQYVQAIRSVNPTGPYRLAGYSGGGVIAYEMAQQLIRSGATVEFVGMIDTLSPAASESSTPVLRKLWLMRKWVVPMLMNGAQRRKAEKQRLAINADKQARILGGEKLTPELIDFQLFDNFLAAQRQYVVEPYLGSVVILRADQSSMAVPSSIFLAAGVSLGWAKHVQGELRVIDVPGSHFTMLAEPGLSVLVEALRAELAGPPPRPATAPVLVQKIGKPG